MRKRFQEFQAKRSIKIQLVVLLVGLLLGTLLFCWIFSNVFLSNYYSSKKQKALINTYTEINSGSVNDQMLNEEFQQHVVERCDTNNITILVIKNDERNSIVLYNKKEIDMYFNRLYTNYMLGLGGEPGPISETKILKSTDNYILQTTRDSLGRVDGNDTSYIEMWGKLEGGEWFIMSTPLQSIREYAQITNEFLAIIILFGLLVGGLVVWFAAGKATRPILELAEISEKMAHLDFNAKYQSGGTNEIGLLGNNFNIMSDTLEKTIAELKSANNELQKDIEEKIQIDEMRKDFLSNVSHELKTPIALIQGYAEGLKENINEDEESRDFYCEVIMDEALKMNRMVKKLLTLNQLEFGNEKIIMKRFDIVDVIRGVIQSADILIQQNAATVIFDQSDPLYVWGDEFKIEEVVTNYFSNALNHLDYEKKIHIKAVRHDKLVRISVFNTGDQIPEEDIENVWVKFYKVDKARTREYGGNGIGLSIVKAIMDSFHKKCGVKNYDNGVEFWFELDADQNQIL